MNTNFKINYLLLFVLLFACKAEVKQEVNKKQPNILFIAIDDLRPDLGIYGNKIIHSPNIDQLGRDGVIFDQAYVQQALCAPSRVSVMTGFRPQTTKVQTLWDKMRDSIPNAVTIPQYFAKHGYTTTAIGKIYHNTDPDSLSWSVPKTYLTQFPFNPECIYATEENLNIQQEKLNRPPTSGNVYEQNKPDRFGHYYVRANYTEMADVPDETFYDGAQALVAMDKLEELSKADKPFFFGLGFYRPHSPYISPKKYWDLYDRDSIPMAANPFIPENAPDFAVNPNTELKVYADLANAPRPLEGSLSEEDARRVKHGYYAAVSYTDAQVGKVINKLKELGIYEETIIVLWSDHGYKLGEHNAWSKFTNYNIDTHAPLIIKSNQAKDNQHRVTNKVEMVDLYPTLCEMIGLDVPDNLEGMSLVPHISKTTTVGKEAIFSSYRKESHWAVPRGNEQLGYSILTEDYHYVEWQNWKDGSFTARELYDLQKDPAENKNVAGADEYKEIVERMSQQLKAGWQAEKAKVLNKRT